MMINIGRLYQAVSYEVGILIGNIPPLISLIKEWAIMWIYSHSTQPCDQAVFVTVMIKVLWEKTLKMWEEEWVPTTKATWTYLLFPVTQIRQDTDIDLDFWGRSSAHRPRLLWQLPL